MCVKVNVKVVIQHVMRTVVSASRVKVAIQHVMRTVVSANGARVAIQHAMQTVVSASRAKVAMQTLVNVSSPAVAVHADAVASTVANLR